MNYQSYLGNAFNNGTFSPELMEQKIKKEQAMMNIVLMGGTGVGKSTLVNAVFGKDIAETGVGSPVTQSMKKYVIEDKGITLWDTKGLENADYENTKEQLRSDIEKGFKSAFNNSKNINEAPHIAWLCIAEPSGRIQDSDITLIKMAKEFNIPVIVAITKSSENKDFLDRVNKILLEKGLSDYLKDRIIQINSVAVSDKFTNKPQFGLNELVNTTKSCLEESYQAIAKHFAKAQKINNELRLAAMIDESKTAVHVASVAAGTAGASPIPGSDAPIIAGIQSTMIYKISKNFNLNTSSSQLTTMIAGVLGVTAVAQVGKAVVAGLLKFIPGPGSIIGGVISASTAVAITEAIGFAYITVLENYFDKDKGEVILPEHTDTVINLLKNVLKTQAPTIFGK